jgi:hypothetical protein
VNVTDNQSNLTALGREVISLQPASGAISPGQHDSMTSDTISAFIGPALGVDHGTSLPAGTGSAISPLLSHCYPKHPAGPSGRSGRGAGPVGL